MKSNKKKKNGIGCMDVLFQQFYRCIQKKNIQLIKKKKKIERKMQAPLYFLNKSKKPNAVRLDTNINLSAPQDQRKRNDSNVGLIVLTLVICILLLACVGGGFIFYLTKTGKAFYNGVVEETNIPEWLREISGKFFISNLFWWLATGRKTSK